VISWNLLSLSSSPRSIDQLNKLCVILFNYLRHMISVLESIYIGFHKLNLVGRDIVLYMY